VVEARGNDTLDLSYSRLATGLPDLRHLSQLTCLNVADNNLTRLCDGLPPGLCELYVQYNQLACLPDSLCSLRFLVRTCAENVG
jgi:Leucine-rich repeat (LRR) protein